MLEDSSSKLQQKNHRGFQSSLDFPSPLCSTVDYFSRNGKRSDHTSFIHPHPATPQSFMPCWRERSYMGCRQATTAVILFRHPICRLWRACVERAKSVFSNIGWNRGQALWRALVIGSLTQTSNPCVLELGNWIAV